MKNLKHELKQMIRKRDHQIKNIETDLEYWNQYRGISKTRKQELEKEIEIHKEEIKTLESFLDQTAE